MSLILSLQWLVKFELMKKSAEELCKRPKNVPDVV
jgi:hypothetical protein